MQILRLIQHSLIATVLFLTAATPAKAQYYQIGADPPSLKWKQIKGDHFDVIYPDNTDSLARRYLYLFEKNRDINRAGLNIETAKVPLILHPYEVRSNGTVVWAPKRAELFTTPPYNNFYPENWDVLLSLHEGRHIGQMTHYTKGFYDIIEHLAGEQAIAVGVGFYPAKSLLEGDAVVNETDFSKAGRGRNADFLMYYRASFVAGDYRSYDRWRYGSYKQYTPNNYVLGYFLNSMMRYNTGNYHLTGDIMSKQVEWWWRVFSVSHKSYQYATGLTQRKNFRKAVPQMDSIWRKEALERGPVTPFDEILGNREKFYSEFTDVLPVDDGFVAIKRGMQYATHLISIDKAGKQKYLRPFASNSSHLIYDGNGSVYFSECIPDPRWELRSFSNIRKYDIASGRIKNVTSRTRYFNPTISPSGNTILAVEYKVEGGSNIVEVNKGNGRLIRTIEAPQGFQLTEIAAVEDTLYTVAVTPDGMGIYRFLNGNWTNVIKDQTAQIRNFHSDEDGNLYFVSDLDGVSNIYLLSPQAESLKKIVSASYGSTTPVISDGKLYYSDYDYHGYKPVVSSLDPTLFKEASFDDPFHYVIADSLSAEAKKNVTFLSPEEDEALREKINSLESKPYSKIGHAIRIHSWAPVYANVDRIMNFSYEHIYQLAAPGLTLISQNDLGTAVTTAGYAYHGGFHSGHINFKYSGLFPVVELSADYNDRFKTKITVLDDLSSSIDTTSTAALDFSANVYIPLDFSRGGWNIGLVPQLKYTYSNDQILVPGKDGFVDRQSLLYSLRYYKMQYVPSSKRTPKWGIGIVASGKTAVGPANGNGSLAYANIYGYTPGIMRDQGIKLSLSWQKQFQKDGSYLPNIAELPRGYKGNFALRDYSKLSVDYSIPVYALESHYSFLGYLKRINLAPFFDIAHDRTEGAANSLLYSYGTLFSINFVPFRFGFSLDVGIRYARTADGRNSVKLVFSSSLY